MSPDSTRPEAMDFSPYHLECTRLIAAPPEEVYDLVADVTRMGEWSPTCTNAEWTDDDHTRFIGENVAGDLEWETICRVDVANRGGEFTFFNRGFDGAEDLVRWSYRFDAIDGGTRLTETWTVLPAYEPVGRQLTSDLIGFLDGMKETARSGMDATLRNLKQAAEGPLIEGSDPDR